MIDITPDFVVQKGSISMELAVLLLNGATKIDLEKALSVEGESDQVVTIRRMNLIGSLRSVGFDVTGGRRGGTIYRIIDWRDPSTVVRETVDDFSPEQKETLEWVQSWRQITTAQASIESLRFDLEGMLRLSPGDYRLHERSLLQLLCYDVAPNRAFLVGRENRGIVLQRFTTTPAFKLIPGSLSLDECLDIVGRLRRISFRPVKILYVPEEWVKPLKIFGVSWETNSEALYSVDRFANRPETVWPRKSLKTLLGLDRVTTMYQIDWGEETSTSVIENWREVNEKKQRQLSIRRDYFSVLIKLPSKVTFLSIRDGLPVSLHVLDRLTTDPRHLAQVTEKSLNYRQQPGGLSGTSDFTLWKTCQMLLGKVDFLNVGHVFGAEQGLADRKIRLADELLPIRNAVFPMGER